MTVALDRGASAPNTVRCMTMAFKGGEISVEVVTDPVGAVRVPFLIETQPHQAEREPKVGGRQVAVASQYTPVCDETHAVLTAAEAGPV
jgi:hypothetical protein